MLSLTDPMTDPLHSQNLVPFKKRRGPYHIPGLTGENEEHALDVDHDLSRDEERYIRHYLGYADALLKSAPKEGSESPEEHPQEESPLPNTIAAETPESEQLDSTEIASGDKAA
jgi:hypothetical protein